MLVFHRVPEKLITGQGSDTGWQCFVFVSGVGRIPFILFTALPHLLQELILLRVEIGEFFRNQLRDRFALLVRALRCVRGFVSEF